MNENFSLHKFSLAPGNQPPSFFCVFIPSGITWLRSWAGWLPLWKLFLGLHWALIPWVRFLFESVSSEIKSFDYMTVRWSLLNSTFLSSVNSSQEMSLFTGREKSLTQPSYLQPPTQAHFWRPTPPSTCAPDLVQIPLGWHSINFPLSPVASTFLQDASFLLVHKKNQVPHTKNRWTSLEPASCSSYYWISLPDFPNSTRLLPSQHPHISITPWLVPLCLLPRHSVVYSLVKVHTCQI